VLRQRFEVVTFRVKVTGVTTLTKLLAATLQPKCLQSIKTAGSLVWMNTNPPQNRPWSRPKRGSKRIALFFL